MRVKPPKHADDPELGRVRWCPRCAEYWPADLEFFYSHGRGYLAAWCKACYLARREDHKKEGVHA
jgi:hypothetical protein